MGVILERRFTALSDLAGTFTFGAARPRGMRVVLDLWNEDDIDIRSEDGAGLVVRHFSGRPLSSSGLPTVFGGPVVGPQVIISLASAANPGRGVLQFFDEEVPAHGQAVVGWDVQTGIAAAGAITQVALGGFGHWMNQFVLVLLGTQNTNATVRVVARGSALENVLAVAGIADAADQFDLGLMVDSVTVDATNAGAVAMDYATRLLARVV